MNESKLRDIFKIFTEHSLDAPSKVAETDSAIRRIHSDISDSNVGLRLVSTLVKSTNGLLLLLESCPLALRESSLQLLHKVAGICRDNQANVEIDTERLIRGLVRLFYGDEEGWTPDSLISAMSSLDVLIKWKRSSPTDELGSLLGIGRCFMFYGSPGWSIEQLRPLFPQPHTLHDDCAPAAGVPNNKDVVHDIRDASGKKMRRHRVKIPHRRAQRPWSKCSGPACENVSAVSKSAANSTVRDHEVPFLRSEGSSTSDSDTAYDNAKSDVERQRQRASKIETRVRQSALALLYSTVCYAVRRNLFGFWPALTPDSTAASATTARTLSTVLLRDPAQKCRSAAAHVIDKMLCGSRPFLRGVAEPCRPAPSSFTPYSATLASLLRELHRYLLLSALTERCVSIRVSVLRALSTLVANTPYSQLQAGLLTRVSNQIHSLLLVREPTVRSAALDVLMSMVSSGQPLKEVRQILLEPIAVGELFAPASGQSQLFSGESGASIVDTVGDEFDLSDLDDEEGVEQEGTAIDSAEIGSGKVNSRPWLWARCRIFIIRTRLIPISMPDTQQARVVNPASYYDSNLRAQSLRCLAIMCRNYLSVLSSLVPELVDLLCRCFDDPDLTVRQNSLRLLECIGANLNSQSSEGDSCSAELSEIPMDASRTSPAESLGKHGKEINELDIWLPLLASGAMTRLADWRQPANVRACLCNALSTLGAATYERLPRRLQLLIVTLLLPMASSSPAIAGDSVDQTADASAVDKAGEDSDSVVCSAAVRALGVLVAWPSLRADAGFMLDVAEATTVACKNSQLAVRTNAIWSLANLTDTLTPPPPSAELTDCSPDELSEASDRPLSRITLASLLAVAMAVSTDVDRVRINAVRAIGNLLRHMNGADISSDQLSGLLLPAIQTLERNVRPSQTGSSLARMKLSWNACHAAGNALKNRRLTSVITQTAIVSSLCHLCGHCVNYKVRTNAAVALASIADRAQFDGQLNHVWLCVLEAMEAAQNISAAASGGSASEWRQRDALLRQLCFTLCSLAVWLQAEDITAAAEVLRAHWHTADRQLSRLSTMLPPGECGPPVLAARASLMQLPASSSQALLLQLFSTRVDTTVAD